MISGPKSPHPRVILKTLLEGCTPDSSAATSIESGLVLLESDLRVGDQLCVDFLARDASGMPVLIVAVDEESEEWAPLQIADLEIWFRENAHLIERAVTDASPRAALTWTRGFRILVVALDVPDRFFRRLELMRGIQMDVFELRSVFVRGETRWLLRGVAPWAASADEILPQVPRGIEDPELGEFASELLERTVALATDIEVRGDRFEREFRWRGGSLLSLQVRDGQLFARVRDEDDVVRVRTRADVDEILDRCLRRVLAESVVDAPAAQSIPRVPLRPRFVPGPRLSEDELSAFYDSSTGG